MAPKGFGRCIVPGQFGFRQGRVDLLVADVVQQNRLPALAAPQFRDKMVKTLRDPGRNRTATKRTVRDIFAQSSCLFRSIPSYC